MAFKPYKSRINLYWESYPPAFLTRKIPSLIIYFLLFFWFYGIEYPYTWVPVIFLILYTGMLAKKEGHYRGYLEGYDEAVGDSVDSDSIDSEL